MKYPVEACPSHDYVWLKNEMTVRPTPYLRLIPKQVYACTNCGVAIEVYDLDETIEVNRSE